MKRTKRIEIVKPKIIKKKSGNVSAAALVKNPLVGSMGLGMARSSGNSKALKIDPISFSKYTIGTLALGYILQIMDNFVVVSLPGGVTGTVAVSEISDSLHRINAEQIQANGGKKIAKGTSLLPELSTIVSLMQPVRCYVLDVVEKGENKKKSLVLSMRSLLVNRGLAMKHMLPGFPISGCISSKEDHGYIVAAGVSAVTFFLPFKAVPAALSLITQPTTSTAITTVILPGTTSTTVTPLPATDLPIGQPIECIVEAVNESARSVTLRAQRKATAESVTKGALLPFNALCPGMKFHINVENIAQVNYLFFSIYIYMYLYL